MQLSNLHKMVVYPGQNFIISCQVLLGLFSKRSVYANTSYIYNEPTYALLGFPHQKLKGQTYVIDDKSQAEMGYN